MKQFTRNSNKVSLLICVRMICVSLCCLFVLLCMEAAAQGPALRPRLDPVFRSILAARQTGTDSLLRRSLSAHFKVQPEQSVNLRSIAPAERYSCIVYTKNPQALRDSGIIINSVLPDFVTAIATLDQISMMAAMPEVSYVKAPKMIGLHNDVAVGSSGAALLQAGKLNNTAYKGKNVLIAIFDTGLDWDHPDFRDPADQTKSRILRIWDQTLTPVTGEVSPTGFTYGVEYTQAQLNDELDGTPTGFVRERDIDGHGTHVTGTAAGNGVSLSSRKYAGIAPEADLIIIKGGNGSFSSDHIIDALTYVQALSASLGRPVVLNMSLGGIISAHDGTDAEEKAVDNFSRSGPGRAVVISAGNDTHNTFGVHNSLALNGNATSTVNLNVIQPKTTGSEVFTYIAYGTSAASLSATLTAPDGTSSVTALAGQGISGNVLNNNFSVLIYNDVDFNNNNRFAYIQVTRNGSNTASPFGIWSLSITNNTSTTFRLDGWLRENATFDSTMVVNGDNNYLVSTPGNAATAFTVGSYVSKLSSATASGVIARYLSDRQDSISSFSSKGPRRDGVLKPDITAVGQGLISCLSSDAVSAPFITNAGLYQLLQGTSQSAPVVTGSVALLFQANPALNAADAKTLLLSSAGKDIFTELPGTTPNSTWGYGKADVFKAASALFNCAPSDRKTYRYDSSLRLLQYASLAASSQQVAVRFTPDISGKLGGAYLFTIPFRTNLFLEVRTNNAGRPGNLLGTINIDSNSIVKTTMNYFDLTSLNVTVTSGTDYFLVLGRIAGNTANWGLVGEAISIDNRSLVSTDGGINWGTPSPNVDFVIRSVVYSNPQLTGAIASGTSADTHDINSSNSFLNNCALIATLLPNGASPVTGSVTTNVWVESSVPLYGNDPFVARHYQIAPSANAASATGRVTLYFTQAEFTAFNNDPRSALDLPTAPTDIVGKGNLRIGKYSGSSNDGTGMPASYNGSATVIDPDDADVVWNADASRWEVSFSTTGFSGFVVQTKTTTLPIIIEYFKGKTITTGNQLSWKMNCLNTAAVFEVERSRNGFDFDSIGRMLTTSAACSLPMSFTDVSPAAGDNYYRIRIIESSGTLRYTGVLLLRQNGSLTTVYPTVLQQNTTVQVNYAGVKGTFIVSDGTGKQLYIHSLTAGVQSLALPLYASGIYFYTIKSDQGKTTGGKLFVR